MPLVWAAFIFGGILLVSAYKNQNVVDTALGREGHLEGGSPSDVAPAAGTPSFSGGGDVLPGGIHGLIGATDKLARLRQECDRIAALNLTYLWGGGHLGYPKNGPFDCSGAVSYVLHAAGLHSGPPWVSGMFATGWGVPGPGQFFTVWANPVHVFLEFSDGRQWGTTQDHNPDGGPAWFTGHTHQGFTARHYRGF